MILRTRSKRQVFRKKQKTVAVMLRSKFWGLGSFDFEATPLAQDDIPINYAFTVVKAKASPSASLASRPSAAAAQAILTA